jgi:hypothetical protein
MRLLLRVMVSGLLATSGIAYLMAAAQRWWPACRLGRFDEPACVRVQNDDYGYLVPAGPWIPAGDAAQLAGIALVCLAVAVATLPWLWPPRHVGVALATGVPAGAIALMGAVSGAEGWVPLAGILWCFGLPSVLLAAAAVRMDDAPPGTTRWRVAAALLLGLANPLADFFIGSAVVGYVSHDHTPWVETVSAALLLSAALVTWPSTRGTARAGGPVVAPHRRDGQLATT